MIDYSELRPGMIIKIVDKFGEGCHPAPPMNEWLGCLVTVDGVYGNYVRILEDDREWKWFLPAIESIEGEDNGASFPVQTKKSLVKLILG